MIPALRILLRGPEIGFGYRMTAIVAVVALFSTLFETAAVLILLPLFQLIQSGADTAQLIAQHRSWQMLSAMSNMAGLPLTVPVLLTASFIAFLARQAVMYAGHVYLAGAHNNLGADLRQKLFAQAIHAKLNVFDEEPVGHQVNTIAREIDRTTSGLMDAATFLTRALVGIAYIAILLWTSVAFTAAALATFGLAALGLRRLMKQSRDVGAQIVAGFQSVTDFLIARLSSIRLIRLSGTERAERTALQKLVEAQRDHLIEFERLKARLSIMVEPLVVGVAFVVVGVGHSVMGLGLGEIGLFFLVMMRLIPVATTMLRINQSIVAAEASLDALAGMQQRLDAGAEGAGGPRSFPDVSADIVYERVSFTYPKRQRPALDDVSLTIPPRSFVALVGPSGAGKSTLVDLLPALRQPDRGEIRIGGVPLQEFSRAGLRRAIGYLPQSPQLFDVTFAEHIRYGSIGGSDEDVRRAAKLAGADGFINEIPGGYNARLGGSGRHLSGGQRQRIDLARVLAGDPKIIILDEPTNHLDSDSEALFRQTLREIQAARALTVIVIGHHLSTVKDADLIFVLQAGRLVEQGTHRELMAHRGWYAVAFDKQSAAHVSAETDTLKASA